MADIRINSLPTTASASSSDDFLALDGATNGTRKLNAYSPTFGGNLTVSGKIIGGNSSDSGAISTLRSSGAATGLANVKASSALTVVDNTTANTDSAMVFGVNGSGAYIQGLYTTVASTITLQPYGGSTTLGGNLTVSGGTIGTAASANLTLNGGSSGASLVLGQGTNGAPTLAAAGSGTPTITKLGAANGARRVALNLQTGADGTLGPVNIELAAYPSATGSDRYGSLSVGDTGAWRPLVLQHAGGNVLIGTTTDSANGKLQLATHTTSAGGIGFGTALSMYRSGDNSAWIDAASGNVQLILGRAGTANLAVLSDGSNVYASAAQAGMGMILRTNGGTTALTLDSSQNATFAGRTSAGTAYGTAKSVVINFNTSTATNVTRTFTVTMPSPNLASTFLLEVGVYGNSATGIGGLLVHGYGYFGSSSTYAVSEISKFSSGNVTISSVTKSNGSLTFTVLDTTDAAYVTVKYSQTSDASITTLPTITSA